MSIYFSELRYPQVAEAAKRSAVAVLPVGQVEEHGPHLPIHTDLFFARRVSEEAVRRLEGRPEAYVLEPVAYGYSQQTLKRWPGTFILPADTVIETVRSILVSLADMGIRKAVVLSMHGNHPGIVRVAIRKAADDRGIGAGMFIPYAMTGDLLDQHGKAGPLGSCHAGEFETSVMLHLAPELVDMSAAVAGDKLTTKVPYSAGQAFISTWTFQESKSGTYGDPTVATAELGRRLFERMVEETVKFIRYYHGLKQIG